MKTTPTLTYKSSGVDIDAGNAAVERIRILVRSTHRSEQIGKFGGFAGLIGLPQVVGRPALAACADGVGTKILVAIAMNRHDTIGIDAVAMNINDLICTGAQPLFVLDYIACAKIDPSIVEQIVSGVAQGCRLAGVSLLGGETAELPGLLAPGHYDLAAFAVGHVDPTKALGPQHVKPGDVVLALPSSGLHSNGYTLARAALLSSEYAGLRFDDCLPGADITVGEALLAPTRIYVDVIRTLTNSDVGLHAVAHITGGGLVDNPPRTLPPGTAMELSLKNVALPPIIAAIARAGVDADELRRTFNCGIGMLLVVDRDRVDIACSTISEAGEDAIVVGRVVIHDGSTSTRVRFID